MVSTERVTAAETRAFYCYIYVVPTYELSIESQVMIKTTNVHNNYCC